MRLIHAKWAEQHDWFCGTHGSAFEGTLAIVCRDYEWENGAWVPCTVEFTATTEYEGKVGFAALRAWAGY